MSEDYYKGFVDYEVIGETLFAVIRSIFGGGIVMGKDQSGGYDHIWSYPILAEAILAFMEWDKANDSEPKGWIRHLPSNRRRPDGDEEKEYVKE